MNEQIKNKIIYIKYGELTLKGKNRKDFVKVLTKNIKLALADFDGLEYEVNYDNLKLKNIKDDKKAELIINELVDVFGIQSISYATEVALDLEIIKKTALGMLINAKNKTFKIDVSRSNKNFPLNSMELAHKIGGHVLAHNHNLKVQIKNPDLLVRVEIKNDCAVIYNQRVAGANGLPVGANGRALVLLSGGIDSPVAAKLVMKRGLSVDFITFITPPHTSDEALNKTIELAKIITKNNKLCKSNLYVCNFTKLQDEIAHISKEAYRITIMRRYFMRIAKRKATETNASALVTGEALGQVASQTLESMQTIANVLDNFLLLRPLLTYDKNEIIELAMKFKTYETSILPYCDSCSLFAPKNPVTKPKETVAKSLEEESLVINDICDLVYNKEITKIKLG